jgi:DNA-binding PadR family transcriptional regulator
MKDGTDGLLPLSPATLHILLALTSGDMHGYAIMQDVLRQSDGRYKLWPGTLYDNLQKLVRQGLVQELGAKPGDDDPRRRYFRLTALGSATLAAEVSRLEGVIQDAKVQLRNLKTRRA